MSRNESAPKWESLDTDLQDRIEQALRKTLPEEAKAAAVDKTTDYKQALRDYISQNMKSRYQKRKREQEENSGQDGQGYDSQQESSGRAGQNDQRNRPWEQ